MLPLFGAKASEPVAFVYIMLNVSVFYIIHETQVQ